MKYLHSSFDDTDEDIQPGTGARVDPLIARTLQIWRERFLKQLPNVRELGYPACRLEPARYTS